MNLSRAHKNIILKYKNSGSQIWDLDELSGLKTRIKSEFLAKQNDVCCYCQRNIYNEFKMVLDIEHILPKGQFPEFTLRLKNLSVSCKRCNLKIKGTNISFLSFPSIQIKQSPFKSVNYKFIHPNIDKYSDHLNLISVQSGTKKLIFYIKNNTLKSKFTYEFFKLSELEIQSMNQIQGIETILELSEKFDLKLKSKIESLL